MGLIGFHNPLKVKREVRILRLLELIRDYCDALRDALLQRPPMDLDHGQPLCPEGASGPIPPCRLPSGLPRWIYSEKRISSNRVGFVNADDMSRHPCAVVSNMMKLSFDDDHRQAMSHLGGLQGLAELLHLDQLAHGSLCHDAQVPN